MTSAGFGKALEQGFVFGIEIQHVAADVALAHFVEQFREALELAQQVARIDGDRHLWQQHVAMRQETLGKIRQQAGRQVVDAVETVVLKYIEGGALARARATADDDQAHVY